MNPQHDKFRANDAKALLENEMFKEAFTAMNAYLESKALTCDPDNKEAAQRVVISKQLLAGIKREIERVIQDGLIADIRIAELERKSKFSVFRR